MDNVKRQLRSSRRDRQNLLKSKMRNQTKINTKESGKCSFLVICWMDFSAVKICKRWGTGGRELQLQHSDV